MKLILTVGTSLYTSATWRPDGPLGNITGYEQWAGEYAASPRRRASEPAVENAVRELLAETSPRALSSHLATPASTEALRFSSEVSTLLLIAEERHTALEGLLSEGGFVLSPQQAGSETERAAWLAARHLTVYLNTWADNDAFGHVACLAQGGIGAQARSFARFCEERRGEGPCTLVVSGGYKAYASCAGFVVQELEGWSAVYRHEESTELVVVSRGALVAGDETLRTRAL